MKDKTSKIEALESDSAVKRLRRTLRSPIFLLILLGVLTLLAYSNTFHSPFVFDDIDNISNNPYVKIQEFSWSKVQLILKHSLNRKRPLSLLSFALNYRIDKLNVFGYHVVNMIIHLLNGLLLFALIKRALLLMNERNVDYGRTLSSEKALPGSESWNRIIRIAFFSTALWLLNPVQIFSVTYIVQRMNSLSAMFSLLCLYCYIMARSGAMGRGQRSDVRSQRAEGGSRGSESVSQLVGESEGGGRSQKSEDRGQRSDVRCQRAEGGSRDGESVSQLVGESVGRGQRAEDGRGELETFQRVSATAGQPPTHELTDSRAHGLTDLRESGQGCAALLTGSPSFAHRLTDPLVSDLRPLTSDLRPLTSDLRPPASPTHGLTASRIFFAACACVSAILAVASKQNAILLPIFIVLYELYFITNWHRFTIRLKGLRKPKVVVSVLISLALFVVVFFYIISYNTGGVNPWTHILSLYRGRAFTLKERLLTQPRVVLYYLSLIFYPAPSRLALLVDIKKSISLMQPISSIISLGALSLLFCSALCAVSKYRLFSFAILWFFVGHLLESTVIPLELVYIHRNYLPSMFLFLPIVAWLVTWADARQSSSSDYPPKPLSRQPQKRYLPVFITSILTAIMLVFAFATYLYNDVWRSNVIFWTDNLKKSPNLHRVHVNYGVALYHSGDIRGAIKEYLKILKSTPHYSRNLYNLGVAYEKVGEYNKALRSYSDALKYNRKFPDAWCRQGNLLIEGGRLEDGISCLYAAWDLSPFDAVINYSLGHALMQKNNAKGALFHLLRAAGSDPEYVDPLIDLGLLHTLLGNTKVAKIYFLKAQKLDPGNKLVNLYLSQ